MSNAGRSDHSTDVMRDGSWTLEGDPSSMTTIDACYEHLATTSSTFYLKIEFRSSTSIQSPESFCLPLSQAEEACGFPLVQAASSTRLARWCRATARRR